MKSIATLITQIFSSEMSPACHHYTTFLLAVAYKEPLAVVLASLLPCFWIYVEVGKSIKVSQNAKF